MEVKLSHLNGVIVLTLIGEVITHDDQLIATDIVTDRLKLGERKFVFDIAEMPLITSVGIAMLVASYVKIHREGGEMKLVTPRRRVVEIIEMMKLDRIFSTYSTVEDAISSWHSS